MTVSECCTVPRTYDHRLINSQSPFPQTSSSRPKMSGPSAEEMEAKRQEVSRHNADARPHLNVQMIASFKDIAAAMTRCVSIIEDYTRLSPSSLPGLMPIHQNISTLSASDIANAIGGTSFGLNAMSPEAEVKKRKPREKKIKDPNAPKRPPSAYILFQNEVRDKVRAENPGKAYKEILAVISEQWKKLPDAEKKVYESAYSDAQSSFRVQDDAYKAGQVRGAIFMLW